MKKLLGIFFISLLFGPISFAGINTGYKLGKGPLKVTKNTADIIEYFFSGGKKGVYASEQKEAWKPGLMAISIDGAYSSIIRHPLRVTNIMPLHYTGQVIADCKKKSGQECFLFANGYKIVWNNGMDRKERILKRKDIKAGKTIALLTELDFFDSSTSSPTTTPNVSKIKQPENKNKILTKNDPESDKDIVKKLKDLKELLDSGVLTDKEFIQAKKKLLN
jgi:hypothetical protein